MQSLSHLACLIRQLKLKKFKSRFNNQVQRTYVKGKRLLGKIWLYSCIRIVCGFEIVTLNLDGSYFSELVK